MFSTIEDVARQPAERQIGPAEQYKHQASRGDHHAEDNERLADFRHAYSLEDRRKLVLCDAGRSGVQSAFSLEAIICP